MNQICSVRDNNLFSFFFSLQPHNCEIRRKTIFKSRRERSSVHKAQSNYECKLASGNRFYTAKRFSLLFRDSQRALSRSSLSLALLCLESRCVLIGGFSDSLNHHAAKTICTSCSSIRSISRNGRMRKCTQIGEKIGNKEDCKSVFNYDCANLEPRSVSVVYAAASRKQFFHFFVALVLFAPVGKRSTGA